MADASCRRELELEIPAEEVSKASEKVAKEFAKMARVPGFRPGKAPISLIKRRFAEDIKSEVLQNLVPETVEKAVAEQKLSPVSQPQVDKLEFNEGQPVMFRASFDVLPEFTLANYKSLEIEMPEMNLTEEDVAKALAEMQQRAAAFTPVEGRAVQNDDFDVNYPADYPDAKLAGKLFHYSVDVLGIKTKKLPELNDEFAKDVSDATSLDELRTKIKESLEHERDHRQKDLQREKVIGELVKLHDFPVPESLVEHQMDVRLERVVRSLAQQGVDPRQVNIDWASLRHRQEDRAKDDVKAELVIDRIASEEKIEVTEEELDHEIEHMAGHSGESTEAFRARLTKQGALDRMKAKLRSDKTIDWLAQNASVKTVAAASAK